MVSSKPEFLDPNQDSSSPDPSAENGASHHHSQESFAEGKQSSSQESGSEDIQSKIGQRSQTFEVDRLNRSGLRKIKAISLKNLRNFIEEEISKVLEKSLAQQPADGSKKLDADLMLEVQKVLNRPIAQPQKDEVEEVQPPVPASEREAELQKKVEILQKRLDKANKELLELELKLERLAQDREDDGGIASVYKDVQSLNQEDPHYETKKGFLKVIFEANRALQKQGSDSSSP